MGRGRIFADELHAFFLTFSCYRRRKLLATDRPKKIVLGCLSTELAKRKGRCVGFVLMPNHVHVIVWFPVVNQLSDFMQHWKSTSSLAIQRFLREKMPQYVQHIDSSDAVWQRRYYPFNIYSEDKLLEKLQYMHLNPVRAGLAQGACDWRWSSARFYESGASVGVKIENVL